MSIVPATSQDWQEFYRLAQEQGWDVPDNELNFHRSSLNSFSFVLKSAQQVQGFVTGVCHGKTAWIGNLIIDPVFRGQGLGGYLFDFVLQRLWKSGAECIWLTASHQGRPLYERRGFELVDEMVRLRMTGTGCSPVKCTLSLAERDVLYASDSRSWGDTRSAMLTHLAREGKLLRCADQIALLQFDSVGAILGPWYNHANSPCSDSALIELAQSCFSSDNAIVTDLLASSVDLATFSRFGTLTQGENVLMAVGDRSSCPLSSLVSLASLGSMG